MCRWMAYSGEAVPLELFLFKALLFQPIILAYLGRGFYVKSANSTWTMGWRDGSATVLPVSLGLGYRKGWAPSSSAP